MHQNDFFYFLKIIFEISASKRFKAYKKKLTFSKKKLNFLETQIRLRFQTLTIL